MVYYRCRRHPRDIKIRDFYDVSDIKDDMAQIDLMMDELEGNIPEDVYDVDEVDVDDLLRANRMFRDRFKEVSEVVIQAISNAAAMKKYIHTHREAPKDPDVKGKRKEIKENQKAIVMCKNYINLLNNKIEAMGNQQRFDKANNKIKKLDRDVFKLDDHKKKLKQKLDNQIATINNLYADPEFKDRVSNLTKEIKDLKMNYNKSKLEKDKIKEKSKTTVNEL